MYNPKKLKRDDLIYPKLCYQVMGILFEAYRQLGPGYQEKYYQKVVALELKNCKLNYKQQVRVPLEYKGAKVGNYFLDFLIENRMVLELKKGDRFSKKDIEQVYAYLKATGLKLGIIANFTSKGVRFKRIVNIK